MNIMARGEICDVEKFLIFVWKNLIIKLEGLHAISF